MLVEFYGLEFDLPDGWEDISEPDDTPALGRRDGIGAIQFSFFSKNDDGSKITMGDLRTELAEFAENTGRTFNQQAERSDEITCVGGRSVTDRELFAAWFLTNGLDMVFMTYNCLEPTNPLASSELEDAKQIVSSMTF